MWNEPYTQQLPVVAEELWVVAVIPADQPFPEGGVVEHSEVVPPQAQEGRDQSETLLELLPLHVVFGQTGIGRLQRKMASGIQHFQLGSQKATNHHTNDSVYNIRAKL